MKKLLVVVDYQNDFVDGALGFKGAEKIAPKIVELVEQFDSNRDDIVFTFDEHNEEYLKTIEGQKLPIPHCIKGTKGYSLYGPLEKYVGKYKSFSKHGFGCEELGLYIRERDYEEIVLCGLVSDICVFTNAVLAKVCAGPYTRVCVKGDATSSYNLNMQEKAFEMLKNLHIEVI